MTEISETNPATDEFTDIQKTRYFSTLSARNGRAFRQHIAEDLWVRNENGERDWGNVSEHCLVEIARVSVLSEMIGLPGPVKKDLEVAAGLHDVHKKQQKAIVTKHGLSYESFDLAAEMSQEELIKAGFNISVVDIAGAVGSESLHEVEILLEKSELTDLEKAQLIMHYVDDYTINADWATPTETSGGRKINALDKRMDANEANERYKLLNEEGRTHFNGETTYEAQRRVGHIVENRLAQFIQKSSGRTVDPLDLPTLVDADIKTKISKE